MPTDQLNDQFKHIVSAVAEVLKQQSFRKSGSRFRREIDGNLQFIEFQRSSFNDRNCLRFTANIGILSRKVLLSLDPDADPTKCWEIDAHLRERLGNFRDQIGDYWWQLSGGTDDVTMCEIVDLISTRVLPFLAQNSSDEALGTIWKSGKSPGMTEGQRKKFLAALVLADQ